MAVYITGASSNLPTLVLSPREVVMYPYALNPSWTTIKLGVAWSIAQTDGSYTYTGVNNNALSETYSGASSFLGFKDDTTTVSPQSLTSQYSLFTGLFVGAIKQGSSVYSLASSSFTPMSYGFISGVSEYSAVGSGIRCLGARQGSVTAFASYQGLMCSFLNRGQTGQVIVISSFSQTGVTPSITGMEHYAFLANMPNRSVGYSGYFTTGNSVTGGPLTLPSNLYIDMKTNTNVLKVYDIIVEGSN